MPNDYFWTDTQQAQERLTNSVVMYDGLPVYISSVITGEDFEDGVPRALISNCGSPEDRDTVKRKKLNSPKFNRFRHLPKLGWINCYSRETNHAVYLKRKVRPTRTHGLCSNNVFIYTPTGDFPIGFESIVWDQGFVESQTNTYPPLEESFNTVNINSSIAISLKYCIHRDEDGIRWLLKDRSKVGLFMGSNTLYLFNTKRFLLEELQEAPEITCNEIREF